MIETLLLAAVVLVLVGVGLIGLVVVATLVYLTGIRNAIFILTTVPRELWRFHRSGDANRITELAARMDACAECDRRVGEFCTDHTAEIDAIAADHDRR